MQKIILIFEVNNLQEDYAKCMAFIEGIEKQSLELKKDNCLEIINENKVSYILAGKDTESWFNSKGIIDFKKVVDNVERGLYGNIALKNYAKIKNAYNFVDEYKNDKKYFYYFRIHTNSNNEYLNIKNIQYYFLFQQQWESISNRVCAFILPMENDYINTKNTKEISSTYFRYSHYTRWINIYGTIFGAVNMNNSIEFLPLTKKSGGVQNWFFPLLEINDQMLQNIQRRFRFTINEGQLTILDNTNIILNDIVQICNRFLAHSIKNSKNKKNSNDNLDDKINEWIVKKSNQGNGLTILELALFINLISEKSIKDFITMNSAMTLVCNLNEGLVQLIENVVRHSDKKKGIFSFSLDKETKSFWELCVLDSNRNDNIVENFINRHKIENTYLSKLKSDICLAHFYKDFSYKEIENKDVVDAWLNFRENNRVSCLGLPHFAEIIKSCSAELFVKSCAEYNNQDERLKYHIDYSNKYESNVPETSWSIPGTQYHIRCEINLIKQQEYFADIPISMVGNLIQDNKVLSKFVGWECKELNILKLNMHEIETIGISENDKKMFIANFLKAEINTKIKNIRKQNKVYFIDCSKYIINCNSLYIEAICKGIINSDLLKQDRIKYIGFINCTLEMMRVFYRTLLSSYVIMNEDIQLYFVTEDCTGDLFISGESLEAIEANARGFSYSRGTSPVLIGENNLKSQSKKALKRIEVFPFDVVIKLQEKEKAPVSLFERYVNNIADYKLTDISNAGYKITNTHMRLGSKVHLHDFFEISHLFQKAVIADKFAFLLIKNMFEIVSKENVEVLFYGYTSYSRMILESLVEMAQKINKTGTFDFAVYQNDIYLQRTTEEISPTVKMYFSKNNIGSYGTNQINQNTKIIQIVPISTTMTTFKKMENTLRETVNSIDKEKKLNIFRNITLFWVGATSIMTDYWKAVEGNNIITDLVSPNPYYFIKKEIRWEKALECKLCYPDDVMWEKPLVETDATSTIPAQLLELSGETNNTYKDDENDKRILSLENHVSYGHISRETNHYQYYIKTASFFHDEKLNIKAWLEQLSEQDGINDINNNDVYILTVPKHHTNVEFSYYINNYYYKGRAHMLIVDSAKEFRSNFIGKYSEICNLINRAISENIKVHFIYIDDTIISGNTFHRVNSLLHSLVPKKYKRTVQCDKVFVLVNRLSRESQLSYVGCPKSNFISYVNVSISSVRTYGSSCVMCNLSNEANSFHVKSSIKKYADYWSKKAKRYDTISFDKVKNEEDEKVGFERFLCSHLAKELLCKNNNNKDMILSIINIFEELCKEDDSEYLIINALRKNKTSAILSMLKVLCRPFFSFGRTFKECILDFYLLLAEDYLIGGWDNKENKYIEQRLKSKEYLLDKDIWKRVVIVLSYIRKEVILKDRLEFLRDYIIEGLSDLRSNYIIRKDSIQKIINFLDKCSNINPDEMHNFYDHWLVNIFRLINGSTDETKCLWLECLLTFGEEFQNLEPHYTVKRNIDDICSELNIPHNQRIFFKEFWNNMIISNTRIYSENIKKINERENNILNSDYNLSERITNYNLNNFNLFLDIDMGENPKKSKYINDRDILLIRMLELSSHLENAFGGADVNNNYQNENDVRKKYNLLYEKISNLLGFENVSIFGKSENLDEGEEYYHIAGIGLNEVRKYFDNNTIIDENPQLDNLGYFINLDSILLKILYEENEYWKIAPLYIYIRCEDRDDFEKLRIIRKVLMFRHQFINWIREDFKTNAIRILEEEEKKAMRLQVDRSGHHLSPTDMKAIRRELQSSISNKGKIDYSIRDWLLLKSYVNTRISKIYRAIWSNDSLVNKRNNMYYNINAKDLIAQDTIKPLIYLSDLFWPEQGIKLRRNSRLCYTPMSYLSIIEPIYSVSFDGEFIGSILELGSKFKKIKCICGDSHYYNSEYIACMILDILFSAVKHGKNWDLFYADNDVLDYFTYDDTRLMFWILKEQEKCEPISIDFSIELCNENSSIKYLVIKNPVYLGVNNNIEKMNRDIKSIIEGNTIKGISLYTISWYIKNVFQQRTKVGIECKYEECDKTTYFIIKLPIIKGD